MKNDVDILANLLGRIKELTQGTSQKKDTELEGETFQGWKYPNELSFLEMAPDIKESGAFQDPSFL